MPGYLTASGIESVVQWLASSFPSICQLIQLPNGSVEGRTIRAARIGAPGRGRRRRNALLLIGGVHARELVNPDLLLSFATRLCQAYTAGTGLSFGPKSYKRPVVRQLVESIEIYVLPLVNPDGRAFVQSATANAFWRKNRRVNANSSCLGVDVNRNYDFLWTFALGATSTNPCSETFNGSTAFSEPETRNVRWLLDTYPQIRCMADVHSYTELVLYPWGDDDSQITDSTMHFLNTAYNGLRGTPGDSIYREYIPKKDRDWFANTGAAVRDAIAAVRGHTYTVQPSVDLYPTSGASLDYAYSRQFLGQNKPDVRAFVFETGKEFQPVWSEAEQIIDEVSAGLVELGIATRKL